MILPCIWFMVRTVERNRDLHDLPLRIMDKYIVQTKKMTLSYNTRNAGCTNAMLITVAGIHSFPIQRKKGRMAVVRNRISTRSPSKTGNRKEE